MMVTDQRMDNDGEIKAAGKTFDSSHIPDWPWPRKHAMALFIVSPSI
jgi:hypothetical protein